MVLPHSHCPPHILDDFQRVDELWISKWLRKEKHAPHRHRGEHIVLLLLLEQGNGLERDQIESSIIALIKPTVYVHHVREAKAPKLSTVGGHFSEVEECGSLPPLDDALKGNILLVSYAVDDDFLKWLCIHCKVVVIFVR